MEQKNDYNINSLIKSLNVLEEIIEHGEMSILELTNACGIGKSTVHRILGTFISIGYVDQNIENRKYFPTLKIFELGTKVANRIPLKKAVKPYLRELFEKCHETVNFGIVDKNEIVFVDKIITEEPLRIDLEVGRRVPAYCSAMGKTILAFSKNFNVSQIHFDKITSKTIDSSEFFLEQLKTIRKNGYSIDNEEFIDGLTCIAVPIKNQLNQSVAAISIATPTIRINAEREKLFIKLLKETASKIGIFNE